MNKKIAFIKSNHKNEILKALNAYSKIKTELTEKQKARVSNKIRRRKLENEMRRQKALEKVVKETIQRFEIESPEFKKIMGQWHSEYEKLVVEPNRRGNWYATTQ
jgi:hypothetical protein